MKIRKICYLHHQGSWTFRWLEIYDFNKIFLKESHRLPVEQLKLNFVINKLYKYK